MSQTETNLHGIGDPRDVVGPPTLPTRQDAVGWLDTVVARIAAPRVLDGLRRWQCGRLMVQLPDGSVHRFGEADAEPAATLRVMRRERVEL